MQNSTQPAGISSERDYATFYVHEALCGIDLGKIEEINKPALLTQVPQAPEFVMGVMNLRGRIVTIIDICCKLDLPPVEADSFNRNIIVGCHDEHIGLRVGKIGDVVAVKTADIEAPPANLNGVQGKFFDGVYKSDHHLIGLMKVDDLLL